MLDNSIWAKLNATYGSPKNFWEPEEWPHAPSITDRVIYHLIGYFENSRVARNALRIFIGIEKIYDSPEYCDWNEVRVATLRDLEGSLKRAGATAHPWELAVTLKDFLQNAYDTLETVSLDEDFKPSEINSYLKQLRGAPEAWLKNETSPYRPDTSLFYKQCKRYRKSGDPLLPESVIHYIELLWGRTNGAPFEFHADKVLSRMGLFDPQDEINTKVSKFQELVGDERPINKHRNLVQFSKTICTSQPHCQICPLSGDCPSNKSKNVIMS